MENIDQRSQLGWKTGNNEDNDGEKHGLNKGKTKKNTDQRSQ